MRRVPRDNRLRLGCTKLLFVVLFATLAARAFQLQVLQGSKLRRLGERQHLKEWIVLPKRGALFDRSGEALALSLEAQSVYARPHRLKDPEETARRLAQILGLGVAEVRAKLHSDKPFVWVKRQIGPREAEQVQALNAEGVGMFYEPHRYYPQGQLAGQVIGFVGRDSEGLEGLELQYNDYIRGETGSSVAERDALGRRVLVQGVQGLQIPPGGDLQLTLDKSIQHVAEKELEAAVLKYRGKAGVAIVVDPHTGEILALANYPSFNPNHYSKQSPEERRNRAVTDSFEPGSTFKTILAAAALEEGVVGKEDLFYCEMGKYAYGGKIIHDTHAHGWLPFWKILQVSSNIGFTKVAEKLKKERFFKYIEKFGFGRVTGVDMPGEVAGLVRRPESWSAVDLATHAFGQGISATPLQMVMAYAAIANGGFLMRPYVVRRAVGPRGEVLLENQPHVVRRVVSEKSARLLASMLTEVTSEGGTGSMAKVEGFEVAGKTGTAQKADLANGGYASRKRVASFIGFVPAEAPRLVAMVLVDEPEANVYGGVVAAPAFRNIARGALQYLGVAPRKGELVPALAKEKEAPPRRSPRRESATASAENGEGAPDFVGLSLREAVEKARELNLKVKMHGNGFVVRQSPLPGSRWNENDVMVLNLQG
ncbi:MAG TPA: penicillin-binding transpeptidase domain-containing protein [candidate division Zixibacteria bacterium]|nr:penicillin-binding transpeptidase domain-containing protein [candidate division Zixibacteria bacterium]